MAKVKRKICVLIPAYKENEVVLESSKAALQHVYSGEFDICVIADGLEPETITTLQQQGAGVIEVNFERSTKGKALLTALDILPSSEYDIAVVLDVDNIMGKNFLEEVNNAFDSGYKVVQAHRTAKNMETSFAFLDACNEEINNHIYRKGHFAVGLSSALIGSGMAFDYTYFKKLLSGIGETVGEDKELDFRIAKDQVKICYLNDVYVYDEKIENAQVFTQQRTRWIASQLEFLKKYAGEGVVQLFKGNLEFFNKVVQAFLVPRMLLIGTLGLFFLLSIVVPFGPPVSFWAALLVMLSASLFVALPGKFYQDKRLWEAIVRIPYAVFCMCLALLRVNKTKASFLPTPHKAKEVSTQVNN
ncbi:glycosyltransferase [Pontibacter silvestris]|uniref:Glycosyltransferase n=1 Tax=Pontibacter silvestris TaxID=2305183 RepID=A0ABW4WY46_9BACT|nr:glycosyltransferase family 2 protein [Pontibacter silvestris]MCC9138827.1 glycosyltransferase family 2 protein [Pontibacter silvestris]